MKVYVEYDLELEEDKYAYETALHTSRYRDALTEADNWLRNKIKHGDLPAEQEAMLQELRDIIHETLDGAPLT